MLARGNQPGEMRHVDQEKRADLVADRAEAGEIEVTRISRAAGNDQFRPMLLGEPLDLVEIDQVIVLPDAILHGVEPFARLRRRSTVSQMPARGEAETHDRIARLQQRHHHGAVGLRPRMRLDVGELAGEQFFRPFDRQRLDRVRRCAALIVAAAGIALGIFVGEDRPLCLEDSLADDIFRCDQLDLGLLAPKFGVDAVLDRRVDFAQPAGEKAVRHTIARGRLKIGGSCHQSLSCKRWES